MLTATIECIVSQIRANNVTVAIHRSLWPVFENNPFVTKMAVPEEFPEFRHDPDAGMFDVSTACAEYESKHEPNVDKNRPQIWTEHCGFKWVKTSPKIYLSDEEEERASEIESSSNHPIISVGFATADYRRNYPYMPDLIYELCDLGGEVWVFHNRPVRHLEEKRKNLSVFTNIELRDLFIRISASDVVVAPDTSILHIAGALGIPMYAIFGPTDPMVRLSDYEVFFSFPAEYKFCGRQYCWYNTCPQRGCLVALPTESIVEGVREILDMEYWGD